MKKFLLIIAGGLMFLSISAQDLLTIGEVYNFAIGDEYHLTGFGEGQPPNADRITIQDRYYSDNGDTVFYVQYHDSYDSYVEDYQLHYHYWILTDTIYYTNLDEPISSIWQPYSSDMTDYDTINTISEEYCDSIINGYFYEINDFEPEYYSRVYGKGLGLVRDYFYIPVENSMGDRKLIYYKKGGEECGFPDLTVGLKTKILNQFCEIMPNPAVNYFIIENKSAEMYNIKIYSSTGSLLLKQNQQFGSFYVDCSQFNSGVYLVSLSNSSSKLMRKVIVQ